MGGKSDQDLLVWQAHASQVECQKGTTMLRRSLHHTASDEDEQDRIESAAARSVLRGHLPEMATYFNLP